MSRYFDWPASLKRFVRFASARAEEVNDALDELTSGLDVLDGDVSRAIKLPQGAPDQVLAMAAGQRAGLLLAFDAAGNISAVTGGGRHRGDWAAATMYVVSDYFRDPVSKDIYSTAAAHTSSTIEADLTAGNIRLAINVADLELARDAAAASAVLATGQVALATGQVALATGQVALATGQADAARAIVNFAGIWGTLSGPIAKPATVHHQGFFYVLLNDLVNVAASEPGVTADWLATGGGIPVYAYAERGSLRAMAGQLAVVDGLGLFHHAAGSDEPDDDESCFSTATGRWLLQAAHWDLIDAWQLPEVEERDAYDEDFASRFLIGAASCAITLVSATSSASFTGTVLGAAIGDRVIATPPAQLGTDAYNTGLLGYHAWVSAANTITIALTNASAAATTTNAAIRAAWPITVLKS